MKPAGPLNVGLHATSDAPLKNPMSELRLIQIPLQAALARLGATRPAAIVSAYADNLADVDNRRRTEALTHTVQYGSSVLRLSGRWRDGEREWPQIFLAILGNQQDSVSLRAWAVRCRREYGQELVIFKSARNTLDILFDSGRTEIWPHFTLGTVEKAYERSRGRGRLVFEHAFHVLLEHRRRGGARCIMHYTLQTSC